MNSRILGLFTLLVVLLSVVGMAYAKWYDVVQIEGTVEMGEFIFGISEIQELGDNEPDLPVPKDVAYIEATLEEPETGKTGKTVYKLMLVYIYNAYPSYMAWVIFNLSNAGTIPAHIVSLTVEGKDLSDGTDLLWYDPDGDGCGILFEDTNGNGEYNDGEERINLSITKLDGRPLVCNQIDPCIDEKALLWLHFKQASEECHTYFFKITIEAVQWNEA